MSVQDIKDTVDAAIRSEAHSSALRNRLTEQMPRLSQRLVLPEENSVGSLMAFVTSYVESVPAALNLVTAISKRLGFFDYAAPFLHLAEDFFLRPPEELHLDEGLEAMLDESFLAHRLMEEINDHHIRQLQRPLLPMDMTEANLIVYHLLGDPMATHLETLVQMTAERLLHKEHLWNPLRELPGTEPTAIRLDSSTVLGGRGEIRLRLAAHPS